MRILTLSFLGRGFTPSSPAGPLTSPRLGLSALKAFILARTAWASCAVTSGPLGVGWADMGASGLGQKRARPTREVKEGARDGSWAPGKDKDWGQK